MDERNQYTLNILRTQFFISMKILSSALFFVGLIFASAQAQQKTLIDKIFATIGSKIILRSDIQNQIGDMQRQGMELPEHAECLILEQEIIKKAMAMQAEKDSLLASDEEVDAEVENRVRYFTMMYGGKNELEQIAGRNVYQMKEYFREPIKEGLLSRNMQKKIIENVKVTPSEVKLFFAQKPIDSLPFYETELQIGQLVMYPKAHKEVEEYTIESLKEIKKDVEVNGKKFESLVPLYSEDPGSKNNGGRYELNKNDKQWDPIFIATAFKLKSGEISKVVKSKFGYHIIQLVSRYGDDAVVRHILKIPPIREQDIQPIVKLQDSLHTLLVNKTKRFNDVITTYNEDDNAKFTSGYLLNSNQSSTLTIDDLDKDIVLKLETMQIGDYTNPFIFTDQRGRTGVKMLYLKSKTVPHRENLTDDYTKISNKLVESKKAGLMQKWIDDKVPNFYLHVEDEYKTCSKNIQAWTLRSEQIGKAY